MAKYSINPQNSGVKTVSTAEAKSKLSELIGLVVGQGSGVIIENHGRPRAALISLADFEQAQELLRKSKRVDAFRKLEQLRSVVSAQFQDMSPEATAKLAGEVSQEAVASLVEKKVIQFEQP